MSKKPASGTVERMVWQQSCGDLMPLCVEMCSSISSGYTKLPFSSTHLVSLSNTLILSKIFFKISVLMSPFLKN